MAEDRLREYTATRRSVGVERIAGRCSSLAKMPLPIRAIGIGDMLSEPRSGEEKRSVKVLTGRIRRSVLGYMTTWRCGVG